MSGLEAIGAAAAILQFVDFASKLLVTGYDIYRSQAGATSQATDWRSIHPTDQPEETTRQLQRQET